QEWINLLFKDDLFSSGKGNEGSLSREFELCQNNPNPFSTTTEISFVVPKDGTIHVIVTNTMGQTIYNENHDVSAGRNEISLNLSDSNDGIYLASFTFDNKVTKRLKIIKNR
ncbi:MAG: T9SS type A sorting domain-containing protein, partial [Bacteroidota bacterium]